MAEVLHRQAEDEVRIANPRLKRATTSSAGSVQDEGLHKIVAVGGGAAGLELVTRLGDRLASPRHPGGTRPDTSLEATTARSGGGQH